MPDADETRPDADETRPDAGTTRPEPVDPIHQGVAPSPEPVAPSREPVEGPAPPSARRHAQGTSSAPRRALGGTPPSAEPPPGETEPLTGETEPPTGEADGPRRLLRSLVKPGKGQLIAAVMLFLVGMAGVMQIRANTADSSYAGARREDLVVLLDGLNEESQRLEGEISDLERTRAELESGADTQRVAREEARQRVDDLSILAGTAPAIGTGIQLRITDPADKMTFDVLLDAVEEMRDAGAEVIEINDSVRVVASTWFGSDQGVLVVDGISVQAPYVLEVIGDPHSLEEAARFRGGIVSEITGPRIGGQVSIDQLDRVVVDSLHVPRQNQYAQPASPQPTPR